jgi:hypothetical protein
MTEARYGRQSRLPEVGEQGQAVLEATEAVLGAAGDARLVEATYLRLAGLKVREAAGNAAAKARARADDKTATAALRALALGDPAARDVADGALRALVTMRAALGIAGPKDPRS